MDREGRLKIQRAYSARKRAAGFKHYNRLIPNEMALVMDEALATLGPAVITTVLNIALTTHQLSKKEGEK